MMKKTTKTESWFTTNSSTRVLQREIWYLNLNPIKGSEQAGYRPAVVISGNMLNKYLGVVIVCPLTTKIKNYKGNVILDPNDENRLKETSEILTFHIRSVAKDRLIEKIGVISHEQLDAIKETLNDILYF